MQLRGFSGRALALESSRFLVKPCTNALTTTIVRSTAIMGARREKYAETKTDLKIEAATEIETETATETESEVTTEAAIATGICNQIQMLNSWSMPRWHKC